LRPLPWLFTPLTLLAALAAAEGQAPATKDKGPPPRRDDSQLVERLLAARKEYQVTLEGLRAHYIATGDMDKARWAEEELLQFHRIPKRAFRLELDVPPPTLKGSYNIPEANDLLRRALKYKDKGGWGDSYVDNQRRAELLLQQLLTNHPQSDKISDAAYHLGDIYESRAYRQYDRAAVYFERCVQWHPKTHYDARLRAARLYDRQLNDRPRALDLYRQVKDNEADEKRLEEANRRINELSTRR
jgi:tetratricopeptide (TPR) repeat protein